LDIRLNKPSKYLLAKKHTDRSITQLTTTWLNDYSYEISENSLWALDRPALSQESSIMKQVAAAALLGLWAWTAPAHAQTFCASNNPLSVPLVANGATAAGTVTVSNDISNIFVQVSTLGNVTMSRLDVATATTLAGIPQSGGQPNVAQFPSHQVFSPGVTTSTVTIPLGTIPFGTSIFVAVHASVDSPTLGHQQAWGAGQRFPCSPACHNSGGCSGNRDDGECHGDGGDDHHGSQKNADVNPVCGSSGDDDHGDGDHGDGEKHSGEKRSSVSERDGESGGGDSCQSGDDHGDSSHEKSSSPSRSTRKDDDEHHQSHDDGGNDCKAGCGASYFVYVVNCVVVSRE
jgi:hypothetical protein